MTRTFVRQMLVILAGLIVLCSTLLAAEDSRWLVIPDINALEDYHVTPNSTALAKALTDAAEYVLRWQLPKDASSWWQRRSQLDLALRKALGLERLPERNPLNARILHSYEMGDYVLENVIFYSRPNLPVTANLYRPKAPSEGKRPAVVCPLGHYLDAGKGIAEYQVLCIKLAKLGFVVLAYDAIGHGERLIQGNTHHEAGFALLPLGQTIAGWMVWDSMRAIDYLLTLPEVDPQHIGVTGNSGGGLNTLFTSALDERVRAAAIAGYVFHFNNWIKYAGSHCTCCYLPGLYRSMEWFEVAGLIAPRAVLMLQGERDAMFPISGARKAGRNTDALYSLLGYKGLARFDEIKGQPHAYSQPYRERMYGWMLHHLMGKGTGEPIAEGDIRPLAEDDPKLICDKEGTIMAKVLSVVDLARNQAHELVSSLPSEGSEEIRQATRHLVRELTAPPDREPHDLSPLSFEKIKIPAGLMEKVFFVSEDGQPVPGLLWLPQNQPAPYRTLIMVNDLGKSAVAESGVVEPLMQRGFAVISVDLRGRGETLGKSDTREDNNFHFAVHSVMWGRPAAGRRAFDLKRAVDFVQRREDLSTEGLAVVGFGDEALTALLAAVDDPRIQRVACAGYQSSFVSQMTSAKVSSRAELVRVWNSSAMKWGRLDNGRFKADLGSVIPSILLTADIPDIASLVFPRKLLFCQARDNGMPNSEQQQSRFKRVLQAVNPNATDWAWYYPERQFDTEFLLNWLAR
jgi:cephalosporin-C deacetylase-like acetyl esterase